MTVVYMETWQGYLRGGCHVVSMCDVPRSGAKRGTDLHISRRVCRLSRILIQKLCVAQLCWHQQLEFGGGQRRGLSCQ